MLTKKQLLDASKCDIHYCKTCGMLPLCENMYDPDNVTRELAKTALAYREMLERLEWRSFAGEHGFVDNCPICGGSKPDGIFGGHWPDCELAALLKESEGKEG